MVSSLGDGIQRKTQRAAALLHVDQFQNTVGYSLRVHVKLRHFAEQTGTDRVKHFRGNRFIGGGDLRLIGQYSWFTSVVHFSWINARLDGYVLNIELS